MADKIKKDSKEYKQLVLEMAKQYLQFEPCDKCGHPVRKGWVCENCGYDESDQ